VVVARLGVAAGDEQWFALETSLVVVVHRSSLNDSKMGKMNSTHAEIMILDGGLNENGMQWPVISLTFFGILSFGNVYFRWSAEDEKKKKAAKKSKKKVANKLRRTI